jgi:Protein of unknown function (DUF2975)
MNANENSPKTNARLNRIIKVSKFLRAVLLAALIVQTIGLLAFVIVVPIVAMTVGLKSQVAFQNCCALADLPFAFMLTLNFFRFFTRLKDGRLFDSQTVRYLETAGKWWILLGVMQIILGAFEVYIFTPQNLIVSGNGIVAGLIVFFIAWLLREAQELQEEQELTV